MAEWKPFDLTWGRSIYYCTECKEGIEVPTSCGKPMYKFCPMCGARMDTADTPQTDSEITRNSLRTDCNGCRFAGTYDTEFPCANCTRKNKDYYDADTPQTDCAWK